MVKGLMQNQRGFTLIEIIVVLIILGILAAVAVPKYFDAQSDAQVKALDGAMAALQASASQDYALQLLKGTANGNSYTPSANAATISLGDFNGTISAADANGNVTLALTSGPAWFANANGTNKTRTLKLF